MSDCKDVKLHSITMNGEELESSCSNNQQCEFKLGEIEGENLADVYIKTLHNPGMLNDPAPDHKLMTISWAKEPAFNPNLVNRRTTVINVDQVNTQAYQLPSYTQPSQTETTINVDASPTTAPLEPTEKTPAESTTTKPPNH